MPVRINSIQHNKELSAIFRQMADCYRYLGPEHRFRAIAYANAARTLGNMTEPVDVYGHDVKKLDQLKGVGESIASKIIEYIDTGHIKVFDQLQQQVPFDLLELMDIEGIGPATVRMFHDTLHVNSRDELIAAVTEGRLHERKGFGSKKLANLLKVLKLKKDKKNRILLEIAEPLASGLLRQVLSFSHVIRASIAGSIRRKSETIGDIDLLVTAERRYWKKIIRQFTRLPLVERVIAYGETRASVVLKENGIQADLRVVHDDEYGAAMLYFTGCKEHNILLRTIARKHGWKINEYGVFEVKSGKRLAGDTEEGIYRLFGLPYIPPEKRLGKDELGNISFA